jgi:hypothetical protein
MFHRTRMVDELVPGETIDEIFDSLPPAALNWTIWDVENR